MWLEGRGLHSGAATRARWLRESGPLRVRRVDGGRAEAKVALSSALEAHRRAALVLGDGRRVDTVEHALAAVAAMDCFVDLVLEVEGPELPILDGTGLPWALALEELGLPGAGPVRSVRREVCVETEGSRLTLAPGPRRVTVTTEFSALGLGDHEVTWDGTWTQYLESIAPARTFGFLTEAEEVLGAGLARGLEAGSVVIYGAGGKADARFARPRDAEEPARHKLLDAIGDLALLGARLEGRVTLTRPGHARTARLLSSLAGMGVLDG